MVFLSKCIIPCGSYVSGDRSVLQGFSTSHYDYSGYALISPPCHNHISDNGHQVALPFPYYIPGCENEFDLEDMENQCFHSLKVYFFISLMNGIKINALLLEIILACNGATMSNRYFTKLGKFCTKFDVSVILDEILTSGRTGGTMLMWHDLPTGLQDAVAFITVAKWTETGIMLQNPRHPFIKAHKKIMHKLPMRGFSTAMDKQRLLLYLSVGYYLQGDISVRKQEVLQQMDILEEETWGKGLLLFCLRRRGELRFGLHTRFLPTLIKGQLLYKHAFSMQSSNRIRRKEINEQLLFVIKRWIIYSHQRVSVYDVMVIQFIMAWTKGHFTRQKDLVVAIISQFLKRNEKYSEDKETVTREVNISVAKATRHGLLSVSKSSGARLFNRVEKIFSVINEI